MFERLAEVERRFEELERLVSDPGVIANRREFAQLGRERAQLAETVTCYRARQRLVADIAEHKDLLRDPDPATHALYDELYRGVYRQMYRRLQPLYREIRRITGYPPR